MSFAFQGGEGGDQKIVPLPLKSPSFVAVFLLQCAPPPLPSHLPPALHWTLYKQKLQCKRRTACDSPARSRLESTLLCMTTRAINRRSPPRNVHSDPCTKQTKETKFRGSARWRVLAHRVVSVYPAVWSVGLSWRTIPPHLRFAFRSRGCWGSEESCRSTQIGG